MSSKSLELCSRKLKTSHAQLQIKGVFYKFGPYLYKKSQISPNKHDFKDTCFFGASSLYSLKVSHHTYGRHNCTLVLTLYVASECKGNLTYYWPNEADIMIRKK